MKTFFFFKRKFWRIIGFSVLAMYIALFFLASPIAKSILEKNSKEWTGRKISIENLWVNIATGNISISGVTLFEKDDKEVFGTIKKIRSSVSLMSLIASKYKFNSILVDELSLSVVQSDSTFNFSDVIEKFRDTSETDKKPVYFELRKISVINSNIRYTNVHRKFSENLKEIHFSCSKIARNLKKYAFNISFKDSQNGNFSAMLALNTQTRDYSLALLSKDLNLATLSPYLRDYISFGSFQSLMSHELLVEGNFGRPDDVLCQGNFSLKNMALSDVNATRLASCKTFEIELDKVDTKSQYFSIKKAHVENPYLFYELNKTGDNFDALLKTESIAGIEGSNKNSSNPIAILVHLITRTFQNFVVQNYYFNDVSIKNGEVKYVDKTVPKKFDYTVTDLNASSDAITSKQDKITINFNSTLSNSGKAKGVVNFDPAFINFDINYTVKDLLISDFSPYSEYYIAHSLHEGKLYYTSTSQIRNGVLRSQNDFQIRNIDVSKKLKVDKPKYYLPLHLAISTLKDMNGDVELNIPIRGNFKDPNYKLGKTIWKVFKNIIFKIAASPYKIITKNIGKKKRHSK